MFDFFRRRTAKELIEQANETYNLPQPQYIPAPMPKVKAPMPKSAKDYFRVGAPGNGMTTLTLTDDGGFSMTLSLTKTGCEQLIRMLRATYIDETPENSTND
jgi:hypothetical protein